MYKKLDNDTWEEYLKKFNEVKNTITAKDFCAENNIVSAQSHKTIFYNSSFYLGYEYKYHMIDLNKSYIVLILRKRLI